VEKGRRVGRRLGFPTANASSGDYVVPLEGVYAAYAVVRKKLFLAAVFVSRKQAKRQALVEAYLIGFHKNILGQIITMVFLEYLRKTRIFPSSASLRHAIQEDIRHISAKYSIAKAPRTQLLVS
jgi:riboflavin kinase/FMN adenylyltransferase